MTVKITLRLTGVDLRDPSAYERIGSELADLFFEANGGVSLASVYTDDPDPVWVAADAARRIAKLLEGVSAAGVHDELVSLGDIAARCGVASEAVRLWAVGKRRTHVRSFPSPHQVVGSTSGGKTMSLYVWREVLAWVREVIEIDPDEGLTYLDDPDMARLNAELVNNRGWSSVDAATHHFSLDHALPSERAVNKSVYEVTLTDAYHDVRGIQLEKYDRVANVLQLTGRAVVFGTVATK